MENGKAVFEGLMLPDPGVYPVDLMYLGDDAYNPSNTTVNMVVVNRVNTTISADPVNGNPSDKINVTVNVTDDLKVDSIKWAKGELKEDCIVREIKEELGIDIYLIEDLVTIKHEYEDFIIILHVFVCGIKYGDIKLTVHDEGYWCSFDELLRFDWDECDIKIFPYLKEFLESKDKQ